MNPFKMSLRPTEIIDVDAPSQGNDAWTANAQHSGGQTPGRSLDNPIILDHSPDIKTPRKYKHNKRSLRKISKDENATKRFRSRFSQSKKQTPYHGLSKDKKERSAASPFVTTEDSVEKPSSLEPPPKIVRITDKNRRKRHHSSLVFLPVPFS